MAALGSIGLMLAISNRGAVVFGCATSDEAKIRAASPARFDTEAFIEAQLIICQFDRAIERHFRLKLAKEEETAYRKSVGLYDLPKAA